jgi:hypothetical protein
MPAGPAPAGYAPSGGEKIRVAVAGARVTETQTENIASKRQ